MKSGSVVIRRTPGLVLPLGAAVVDDGTLHERGRSIFAGSADASYGLPERGDDEIRLGDE